MNRKLSIALVFSALLIAQISSISAISVKGQEDMPREQTLKLWIGTTKTINPESANPFIPQGCPNYIRNLLIEDLFYRNTMNGTIQPWLAESFEYSPDFKSLTIHLRKDATWSDGKPFTADDVVFTYTMLMEHAPSLLYSAQMKEDFESVEKIDDYTVKINYKEKEPTCRLQVLDKWLALSDSAQTHMGERRP